MRNCIRISIFLLFLALLLSENAHADPASVTLNAPQTDPSLNVTQTFVISCTPNTDGSPSGTNMSFEYNSTGNPSFIDIPTTGTQLTANDTAQQNIQNNTMYSRSITAVAGDDYYVRCRIYNYPVAALKGGRNGQLYVPNATYVPNLKYLKVSLWCNMSDTDCNGTRCGCTRMQGDQVGGASPYPTISNWPDGSVGSADVNFINSKFGSKEGMANWDYIADCVPDRRVDGSDTMTAALNGGQSGSYSSDFSGIRVLFNNNPSYFTPDANGYIQIPADAVNFTVYNGTKPVMALVIFYNTTYPLAYTNVTSNVQKVSVRYPPKLTIAEFRMYQGGNAWVVGSGNPLCDITSSFGSSIPNSNCSNPSFYESGGMYRGEIEICNDQLFGRDVGITGVVQGNLTSSYMNWPMGVVCYSDSLGDFVGCDNTTVPNALYIVGSTSPPIAGTKIANTRTSSSCQWYAYSFMAAPVVNNTLFTSNVTTVGATIGSNPQVGSLSILLYTISNMKIAEFRLYQSSNMIALGSGTQLCDITSSFESSIADNSACTGLISLTQYRAEVRVCQDWLPGGKNISITGLMHGNLSSNYIWNTTSLNWGGCANGNGALTPINCDWNTTVPNGVYINTSTSPQFATGNRTSTSCQWFAYNFTTGPLANNALVISNLSTRGVSSGINPQVNNLTISIVPQYYMGGVTLNPPSADLNVTDLSNFGMTCTANTRGGYNINITFEYNSTTQGWGAIPASGASFTINGNNPEVNVSNGGVYAHTVNVSLNSFGTYWVRCRISNASISLYSNIIKIGVYPAYLNISLQNPSPLVYNSSNPFVIGQYSTLVVNSSVNCNSIGSLGGCGGVSCSVRYNSSSALADTLVNETLGATPFYVISSNMTHDFTGVSNPSTTHQALYELCSWGKLQYTPPSSIFTGPAYNEPSTMDYALLSSEDGLDSSNSFWWNGGASCQQFRFQVNESTGSINKIRVYYKGHSSSNSTTTSNCDTVSYLTRLYMWNFTSGNWSLVGSTSSNSDDVISVEFNSSFSSIVNSSYMYLLASADLASQLCKSNVSTDYVKVDVQLSNKNILPCGNLSANQTCKFSWLLNVTGVNELRAIDINCSSNKTTVASNHSNDSYISIIGFEVHTDKSTYRNCGGVYYKVSVYDSSNNLLDQNLTVSIYDPLGNIANQSKVQTSMGVYKGFYWLQGSTIGEWFIRAASCGIFNKTFGVGIGNSSAFWKAEWQIPNRVKYSPFEKIPITIRFYNQLGEGQNAMALVYLDGVFGGSCSSTTIKGQYDCSVNTPASNGTHPVNIYCSGMGIGVVFNETRYIYVG